MLRRYTKRKAAVPKDGPLLDLTAPGVESLSETQRKALDAVASKQNVFITGRAGCGKSNVIRTLMKCMDAAGTVYAVAAPTGIAAEQVGGVTIHSLVGLNEELDMDVCIQRAKRFKKRDLAPLQVLVVDEVSMLSEETFGKVLRILSAFHPERLPVLVLVGDFLQLPPVQGTLLLNTPTWESLKLVTVLLTDCFRQDSSEFLKVLDEARVGCLSDESVELLRSRVDVVTDASDIEPTILLSRRAGVDELNQKRLLELSDPPREFKAKVYDGTRVDVTWTYESGLSKDLPDDLPFVPKALIGLDVSLPREKDRWMEAATFVSSSTMVPILNLAIGAQVVFVANVSPPMIVNGTRGVVTSFTADGNPVVRLVNKSEVVVTPWRRSRRLDKNRPMPCLVYEQLPLQLAWALTIHKSQGMSLDLAKLDLGRNVFSDGQAYVALSRLRDISGMVLLSFEPKSVTANATVVEWYQTQTK